MGEGFQLRSAIAWSPAEGEPAALLSRVIIDPCIYPRGGSVSKRKEKHLTTSTQVKKIRAIVGLAKMPDENVKPFLHGSLKGLSDNAAIFAKPPVELAIYQAAIEAYEAAIPAALDGSKTAIAQKNKLRDAAIRMYIQLAHYVEANCNDDMATFLLSGFQAAPTTKTPPQPLDQPTIVSVVQGAVTGQLKIQIGSVAKALSYHLRYAAVPSGGGAPAQWTEQIITSTKPTLIEGLTPGTIYTFQIRALGRLGFTDWSDFVNRMVT